MSLGTSATVSQPAQRIRVVVVDDQRLFVYGVQMLIESQPDLELVGSATDGKQAVALVRELQPDVVLMDIRMPVMDGIEATYRITQADKTATAKIVILTTFQREEAVYHAMKHGASAFLTKDATPERVLETIRTVHSGVALSAPGETVGLIREFADAPSKSLPGIDESELLAGLSPREKEIFLLAARGMSNAEIAEAAFISETTTKTHIRGILNKLGLLNRVQIVVFAYENGLITP